ncbi:MAG: alpha/beta fold hydrolase [Proteobacteria bacterium]|nr:alpha/beta fold hydrolase [Pseudomonadota bacterium]
MSRREQKPKKNAATKPARPGPRPVHLHFLNTANMLSAAALPLIGDPEQRAMALKAIEKMTGQMLQGLDAYKVAPVAAYKPDHPCIWQKGSTKLLEAYASSQKKRMPVLIVPSLINRHNILDLDAQHSFTRHLTDHGFAAYILNWGDPTDTEKQFTVSEYITDRLYPALAHLYKTHGPVHVVGYCMGGTMAAGALAVQEGHAKSVKSLSLLAAPWDFKAGDSTLPLRMETFSTAAEPVMTATGVLPVDWIQALFASVDPLFMFNKFRAFAEMDKSSPEAQRFVIVEDWLNDGVELAAPAARQALREWYIDNQPISGVWTIGKSLADAAKIKVPTLVVAAANDRLVPKESALAIAQQIGGCHVLTPEIGHIGMMASARAVKAVWEPVVNWLLKNN